jgi:hypothetical protein
MKNTIGSIVIFILAAGMIMNGSINLVPALQTVMRFFAGGLNAVVNDGKQEIIINVPSSGNQPERSRGYEP